MHWENKQSRAASRPRGLQLIRRSVAAALNVVSGRAGYVGLLALGTGFAPVFAQDAATADSPQLEVVTVSATRRDTTLLETPMAISAVTSESLVSSGVTNMQDISVLVPTMRIEGGRDGGGRMTMRGIRAPGGEATVGLYYGEVPMFGPSDTSQTSGSFTQEANLFDVQRIEALRGPQGTLYGSSSMGGAVRVLFNEADTRKTEGVVDTSISTIRDGDFSTWIKAAYNLPLIDDVLGIRVAAWKEDRGGYVDDAWSGRTSGTPQAVSRVVKNKENINTGSILGGRVMVTWNPADFVSWHGMAMYQESERVNGNWDTKYPSGEPLAGQPTPGDYKIYAPVIGQSEDDLELFSSDLEVKAGFVNVNWASSYYRWERTTSSDFTYTYQRSERSANLCRQWLATGRGALVDTPPPPAASVPACTPAQLDEYTNYSRTMLQPAALVKPNWVTTFVNEMRITSNGDGPVDWLVGAYREERKDHVDSTIGQAIYDDGLIDDLSTFPVYWYRFIDGETEQTAFFGDITWRVGSLLPALDGLSLNYGLRRFDFTKSTAGGVLMNGWGDGNFVQDPVVSSAEVNSKGWLYKYNVSYDFANGPFMTYATVSKGYRAGGVNVIPNLALQFTTYQPDWVWNYEVGGKGSWFGGGLTVDASVYQVSWENTQTTLRTPNNCCAYIGNAGKAEVQGTEIEITQRVFPGLTLITGISYNWKSELTEDQRIPDVPSTTTQGLAGDRLPYVPKLNASFSIDYQRALSGEMTGLARINYSYTGTSMTQLRPFPSDLQTNEIGGFSQVNLRLGVERSGWTAYLFVNNLLDSVGVIDAATNRTATATYTDNRVVTQTPREIGLNVRKMF
jgi:outer membrane receptor protein involved in Fe transport